MSGKKFLALSKISAFVMILSLIVQSFVPALAETGDEVQKEIAYLNNVELLKELGIVINEDGMQYSEENITRENFAQMLGVFYGTKRTDDAASYGRGLFEDVDTKSKSCALIEKLADAGVMNGYKDGKFRPTANLTVEQAVRSFVVLLGYDVGVLTKEFSEYIEKGNELGLLKGIKTEYLKPITKGELVKMFSIALDTEILQLKNFGYEMEYEAVKNETLLTEKLGVYKIDGVLQATDITGIEKNEPCRENYIIVDGYEIQTDRDMNEYLGMDLNVYCEGEDYEDLKLIYFFSKEKKNQIVTVNADELENVKDNVITYTKENKLKKIKLPENVTVIFNGKNYPLYNDETFKILEGSLRLSDREGDGKFETVFVKSYFSIWVEQIYNEDGKISIMGEDGSKYFVNTEDTDKKILFKKGDAPATYEDLKIKSVVSFAADKMNLMTKEISEDAECIEILISDNTVAGKLEKIDKNEKTLVIDGVLYKMNKELDLVSGDISLGDEAKFYLDVFGEVIAAEKGSKNLYGILEKVFTDDGEEYIAGIKIFTADGAFKTLECAKKITIDGKKYSNNEIEKIKSALETGSEKFFSQTGMSKVGASNQFQLVKYETNVDGQIIMFDTLVVDSKDADIEKNNLKFSKKFDVNTRFFMKAYATTIQGGYSYDNAITIFRLPSDKSNREAFSKKSDLSLLGGYEVLNIPVYAFDADEFKFIPVILAETEVKDNVPAKEGDNMMVFERLTTEINENDEVYNFMNGTSIKSGKNIKAAMDDAIYEEFEKLGIKSGDVVRWSSDDSGVVKNIELTMKNIGNESVLTVGSGGTGIYDTGYYSDFRITCGTVEKYNNKCILFNNGSSTSSSLINPSAKILVYNSKTRKTEIGDYSDIKTKEVFKSEASLVFTYQWYAAVNTIVVFN